MSFRIFFGLFFALTAANAAPIFGIGDTDSTTAVSNVSTTDTDALVRPARLSQIAYCSANAVLTWQCGPPCDALPGIDPLVAGGDDGLIPMYFIAHDPNTNSIIVAHQGTDAENILSIANDVQIALVNLDSATFPNADSSIKVHDGFQKTFLRTAPEVLGNVTAAVQSTGATTVEVVGHSLGAAIAVMDAVMLRQNLDSSVSVVTRVFGLPRSGNQDWANFVDQTLSNPGLIHVHNREDPVGTVPPRVLDYQHPSGEFHIQPDNSTLDCSGQENQDSGCVDGESLLKASVSDHLGPYYDGISMGGKFCPL